MKCAKKVLNYSTYDVTHKKPKTKKYFFIADAKTSHIFWGFEQLSSAIDAGVIPMQRHVQTAGFNSNRLVAKVLTFLIPIISGASSLEKRGLSQKGSFCYHFSA